MVLTGFLRGCTTPFIRRNVKGLRDVTATSLLGQAWAEVTFLLGKLEFVLLWLINQGGTLAYLAALKRAPLSVTVTTANSTTFLFTGLTGMSLGTEEPMDGETVSGLLLILLGTGIFFYNESAWSVPT